MMMDKAVAEKVEDVFKAIYTNKEEAKELGSRNTEMINTLAEELQMEKKDVRLAFKVWSEQFKEKPTDLPTVSNLLNLLEVGNE